MAFTVHGTKKLLDRVPEVSLPVDGPGVLGNWYATAWFWKPQLALFVNETTLLPVITELAPAASLLSRFPNALANVLAAHGVDPAFIDNEVAAMGEGRWAKTANRSVVGIMNEFSYLADARRQNDKFATIVGLSLDLSRTPCSPLYKRHTFPDRELHAHIGNHPKRPTT
jgi:hypothetical protein